MDILEIKRRLRHNHKEDGCSWMKFAAARTHTECLELEGLNGNFREAYWRKDDEVCARWHYAAQNSASLNFIDGAPVFTDPHHETMFRLGYDGVIS